jgi:hypothetical protein
MVTGAGNPTQAWRLAVGEYRSELVRIGSFIGWSEADVINFAERITRVRWEECKSEQFDRVVAAYGELATEMRSRSAPERS